MICQEQPELSPEVKTQRKWGPTDTSELASSIAENRKVNSGTEDIYSLTTSAELLNQLPNSSSHPERSTVRPAASHGHQNSNSWTIVHLIRSYKLGETISNRWSSGKSVLSI